MNKYLIIKLLYIFLLLLFFSHALCSQNNILSGMQGLSLEDIVSFEIQGYNITITKEEIGLNKKGIEKIKKEYGFNNAAHEYTDNKLKWQNRVIEKTESLPKRPGITDYKLCYLLPETDNKMITILFHSVNQKDTLLEQSFLNAFFDRSIVNYVSDNWIAEKIDFVGREITLGNACEWVAPHNVHCPAFGQISWSVFRNKYQADLYKDAQILLNKYNKQYKQIKEDTADVIFEGYQCKAKRIIYQINKSKLFLGGRNLIAVYYLSEKIRGKFISCVLTHYIEYKDDYRLPPLIEEIMKLKTNETQETSIFR